MTHLYPATAATTAEHTSFEINGLLCFSTPSSATWSLEVDSVTEYDVNVCAKSTGGERVELFVNEEQHTEVTTFDTGWFHARLPAGLLRLRPGVNRVSLRVATAHGRCPLDLRTLELVPVARRSDWERPWRDADIARADHGWMAAAGYGVMCHLAAESFGVDDRPGDYAQAVDAFDVEAYADLMADCGASWVLFTISHIQVHCPAPLASWERVFPGRTTRRDLVDDLAAALGRRGIRLMLYISSHVSLQEARKLGMSDAAAEGAHLAVLDEFGRRYGDAIAGWWFDGWGWICENVPEVNPRAFYDAAKTAHRDRLVACNFWTCVNTHPWSDYWAGEVVLPPPPMPGRGRYKAGPAVGQGRHLLLCLNRGWAHDRPGGFPAVQIDHEALAQCVDDERAQGGGVTINLAVSREGYIGQNALAVMRRLRASIHG